MANILMAGGIAAPDVLNTNDASAKWSPGTKFVDQNGNAYVYVQFNYTGVAGGTTTIDWTAAANTGTNSANSSIYQVIQPTTATLDSFAGIAMNAVTSGNYGFIQVSGYNQIALVSTTLTSGKSAKCSNAANTLVDDTAQGTAPSFAYGANTIVSVTTAVPAIGTVFIRGMLSVLGV